ncbi:MAG: ABC transporter ATP-binding protein [Bacteroidia bacterium]|nr:ABC transporter ATP-binding protein [Bacteroidia bacterium]
MIHVKNLNFTYQGNKTPTVRGLCFDVASGEILGFLGPSGAGKSTVQKILIRLLKGYSGEISVMNKPLSAWDHTYYEHIGVGFELPNHYLKLSARENLLFFASFYRRKTADPMELLAMVGLGPDADKRVEEFSKGMKMRLNFVRALLHDPEILFFDEPTSGLDPLNARIMKDIIIQQKNRGKTIFLTTHNMHDANELCDQVAFISEGEIRTLDTPRQLRLDYGQKIVEIEYRNGSLRKEAFPLENLAGNGDFQQVLQNYPLESIHSKEASLEDIFIQVTGKRLI